MRELLITQPAEFDLEEILTYTLNKWGRQQVIAYNQLLTQEMEAIRLDPFCPRSKAKEEIFPGLRAIPAQSHLIFYFFNEKQVKVLRILHQRMDPSRHLDGE